jgi:hypothetical protein
MDDLIQDTLKDMLRGDWMDADKLEKETMKGTSFNWCESLSNISEPARQLQMDYHRNSMYAQLYINHAS